MGLAIVSCLGDKTVPVSSLWVPGLVSSMVALGIGHFLHCNVARIYSSATGLHVWSFSVQDSVQIPDCGVVVNKHYHCMIGHHSKCFILSFDL